MLCLLEIIYLGNHLHIFLNYDMTSQDVILECQKFEKTCRILHFSHSSKLDLSQKIGSESGLKKSEVTFYTSLLLLPLCIVVLMGFFSR